MLKPVLRRALCLLSACLLLSACSWWPWGNGDETPPPPKTIGVISVLSDHVTVIDATGQGWMRHRASYPLGSWPIDALATQTATAWLQKKDFDVRPVTVTASAFAADALGGPVARRGWLDRARPNLVDIIHHNVQPADLPYYLLLVEASGSDSIPDLHGIGFVHFSGKPQAFVLYHAFLIDGKSGETIDSFHADADNESWGESSAIAGPNTDLPKAAWPKQVDAWTEEQQAAFRDAVERELRTSLKSNLPRLDLP
ncbi:MAG TPA: hypothetical protein VM639_04755 [Dongiaceae bacterium]|nr:hypothetical protein [Dongiaceae bacterium]